MDKKKTVVLVIVAIACVAVGIAVGFIFGQRTSEKTDSVTQDVVVNVGEPVCKVVDFKLYDELVDAYATNENYGVTYLMNAYNMDKKTALSVSSNPEEWLCFNLFINVMNEDELPLYCHRVACDNNGKDNIYVFTESTEVRGVESKGTLSMVTTVLVKNNELSTDQAFEALKGLDLTIAYGDSFDPDDCELKFAPVQQ